MPAPADAAAEEAILRAFKEATSADAPAEPVSDELLSIITDIAKTGIPRHEWELLGPTLRQQLRGVLAAHHAKHKDNNAAPAQATDNNKDGQSGEQKEDGEEHQANEQQEQQQQQQQTATENFEEVEARLVRAFDLFQGAPFTIQRLCELLTNPDRLYKSTRKLTSALDKLLNVSTTLNKGEATPFVEPDEPELPSNPMDIPPPMFGEAPALVFAGGNGMGSGSMSYPAVNADGETVFTPRPEGDMAASMATTMPFADNAQNQPNQNQSQSQAQSQGDAPMDVA